MRKKNVYKSLSTEDVQDCGCNYRQIESELVSLGSHLWRLDVHSLHSLTTLHEAEDILLLAIPHSLWNAE